MRVLVRSLLALALIGALAAGWDFFSFVQRVQVVHAPSSIGDVQAVATLTGAADARIRAGVSMAEARRLPHLISGVHVDTTLEDIARIAGVENSQLQCCVTLGRAAASTEGNGEEVAGWARRNQVVRILVVTSDYHMERALVELRRAMPEGEFIPYAVPTTRLQVPDWYLHPAAARLLASEWLKFRIASMRAHQSSTAKATDKTAEVATDPAP